MSSLPVPDSPVISTRVSVLATIRACCRQPSIAGLRVMISALHSSSCFGRPETFIAFST